MVNLGICDDEKALAEVMQMVAADYFETQNIEHNIILTHNVIDFLAHKSDYNIVLIDVDLRDKTTGIDAVSIMQEINKSVQVIFMSGINREDTKNVQYLDFLLKPFDINALRELLGRAMNNIKERKNANK